MTKRRPATEARQEIASYRVNARFDGAQAEKLAFLMEQTGHSTSDVLREAIDHYYELARAESGRKQKFLATLIGKYQGEGPEDLSENYKRYLSDSLAKKHGYR